jgi:nitrite reductase/ring-hydroxylating ferredoxin subunit
MPDFVKVATLSELPPGSAKMVRAGSAEVAIYNVEGSIHATSNACPHRGGSLGEGTLASAIITCPWHSFQFDVTSGACRTNPALKVACYPVRLDGQDILVQV